MIKKHALAIIATVILTTLLVLYLSRVEVPDDRLAKREVIRLDHSGFIFEGK